jgi:hypothetical protein
MQDHGAGTRPTKSYPAEKARGGEIILRRRWQRAIFILGLAAPFALFFLFLVLQR